MKRKGQVMLMSIIAISGTLLGATTLAGLLMIYQLHGSTDSGNSAKAIFAADTGIDWGMYQNIYPTSTDPAPRMSNGGEFTLTCSDASGDAIDCTMPSVKVIRSVGHAGTSYRALEVSF
jgi:hypothetical protein